MEARGFYDPKMHAPGSLMGHCLPSAGVKAPVDYNVYRYNRVVPSHTSDPCIDPHDGYLICPPDCGQEKRNDLLPPAGLPSGLCPHDVSQFYQIRQTPSNPKPLGIFQCQKVPGQAPCSAMEPVTDMLQCPCSHRPKMVQAEPMHQSPVHHHGGGYQHRKSNGQGCSSNYVANPVPEIIENLWTTREGAVAPTPNSMARDNSQETSSKRANFGSCLDYVCQHPYYPSGYVCRPVYDRKYLDDCPEQNGPPGDVYTFL